MLGDQGGQGVASNVPCGTGAVVKLGMDTLTRLTDTTYIKTFVILPMLLISRFER